MTKALLTCLAAVILLTAAACSADETPPAPQQGEPTESAVQQQASEPADAERDHEELLVQLPEMDAQQQALCGTYLEPLLYSNFFVGDYISKTLEFDWGQSGIITIYQDLAGIHVWTSLVDEQYQIPAEEVEAVLMRYFPLDVETIRILADSYYDAGAAAYTMVERGGGGRAVVVTGSNQMEDGTLVIRYDLYDGPDSGDLYEKAASGQLQVELFEDGQFHYINNEITYGQAVDVNQ